MRDAEETLLLKPREAAKLLNISTSKIYDALARGEVPAVRVAGCLRVPRAWLDRQIDGAIAGTQTSNQRR
jgi:excisionase family DNA binding protein